MPKKKKKTLHFFIDYKKQCISQHLIFKFINCRGFYCLYPNRDDWPFKTLPCRIFLIIHRVLFYKVLQKASKKKVCVLGFSRCCSICPADGTCFQAAWGRTENTVASLQPHSPASRQQMVCPHLCWHMPADRSCCYPSEAHTIVPSSSFPSLWSTACLCFLFHSCAGLPVCVEDQFKVRKKVAHLVLGTSSDQGPWPGSAIDCLVMERWGQVLSLAS